MSMPRAVRASVNANSTENVEIPEKLFLDRNWPVSFHKPTMKAADGKVSHAQSRACSAA
jgi:hypothetical protein